MERQTCHSPSSVHPHSQLRLVPAGPRPAARPDKAVKPKLCKARKSKACQLRGGQLEPDRRKTAKYCRDCGPLMKRIKSAQYKRRLRTDDWREYRDDYYGFFNEEDERAYRREYMSARRAWPRHCDEAGLSFANPEDERAQRSAFIHARLEPWRQQRQQCQPANSARVAA